MHSTDSRRRHRSGMKRTQHTRHSSVTLA